MTNHNDKEIYDYVATVRRFPLLTREEEARLARSWRASGDPAAADAIVRAHLRSVVAIALKYRHYGVPLGELVAEGNFGLVHALRNFDPERGIRFVTYAAYWIRAYILNHVTRSWSMVASGSGALRSKVFFRLRRERNRLSNLIQDPGRVRELLAAELGTTESRVSAMLQHLELRDVSLEMPASRQAGATTIGDTLPAPDQSDAIVENERRHLLRLSIRDALERLDARERYIVEHHTMADEAQLTLAEIGRHFGVSRERVRQIQSRAHRKLKRQVAEALERAGISLTELENAA